MDNRWNIHLFLEKMAALLEESIPGHNVAPANTLLTTLDFSVEVSLTFLYINLKALREAV